MLENIELCGYENPTPIQKFTIPSILMGHDVIGIAQTGMCDPWRAYRHR
jgi:ATP-dependent RNA helicase DDX3X